MWIVRLTGKESALSQLSELFDFPDLSVSFEREEYWLRSGELTEELDNRKAFDKGERLIAYLNQVQKLYSNEHDVIESDGYCVESVDGDVQEKFKAIVKAQVAIRVNTMPYGAPDPGSYSLYQRYENVRYVLAEFNKNEASWFSLFYIHETIAADNQVAKEFGTGLAAIKKWGGSEKNNAFLATANRHRHSNYAGSGGKQYRPPKKPMRLEEAEEFIRAVIIKWLAFKGC